MKLLWIYDIILKENRKKVKIITQSFGDLKDLVYIRISGEEGVPSQDFRIQAPNSPNVNLKFLK